MAHGDEIDIYGPHPPKAGIRADISIRFTIDYAYNMKLDDVIAVAVELQRVFHDVVAAESKNVELKRYGSRSDNVRLSSVEVKEVR